VKLELEIFVLLHRAQSEIIAPHPDTLHSHLASGT
jgi:hypothetical protein